MTKYIVVNAEGDPIYDTISTSKAESLARAGTLCQLKGYRAVEWVEDGDNPFVPVQTTHIDRIE